MSHSFQVARENKEEAFDGKFYFGVKTTGIFCKPSCPAPIASEKNVEYFDSVFEAIKAGYRPCKRCQPDITVDYYGQHRVIRNIVDQGLDMIYDGYLSYHSIKELADALHISDRQLRQLFVDYIGVQPVKVAQYHKAIFAKKLLLSTDVSVTEVAYGAGFKSTRQFNDVYKEIFNMSPSETRKLQKCETKHGEIVMKLPYQKPFDYQQILGFMRDRALKGVEVIDQESLSRTFRLNDARGYFTVKNLEKTSSLELSVYCDDVRSVMTVYNRVKHMFDLDCDLKRVSEYFSQDFILKKRMNQGYVPRLPVAFNTYEFIVRAILGQQITVKAATTLAGRITEKVGIKTEGYPEGLDYYSPTAEEIMNIDLGGIGITGIRQRTIQTVTEAVIDERVSLSHQQSYEQFSESFIGLKGIGQWTTDYVAMRGLGMVDAFPAADLGIIKALSTDGEKAKVKDIIKIAEAWRPYRAYAALCFWQPVDKKED